MSLCDIHKNGQHSDFPLSYFQTVHEWSDFTVVTNCEMFLSIYMVGGGVVDTVKKLDTPVWIFWAMSKGP